MSTVAKPHFMERDIYRNSLERVMSGLAMHTLIRRSGRLILYSGHRYAGLLPVSEPGALTYRSLPTWRMVSKVDESLMKRERTTEGKSSEHTLVLAGFRFAFSLTQHEHDAEDLVQHACLKVFRVKGRLDSKPYLLKTIRNLFYDSCRHRSILKSNELPDDGLADPSPNPTRVVDGRLDLAAVLATLNNEEREVLYLNCVENYSTSEISEMTGKPRGTILSQLSRAKQKVKQQRDSTSFSERTV